MMFRRIVIVATLAMAACNFGPRPDDFPTAATPAGVRVAIRIRGEAAGRTGELYAVDAGGILLRNERLLRVSWQQIVAMDVMGLGSDYDIALGETVSAPKRERLALVTRFPQGLSSPLLERVLALIPQPMLDSLR